MNIKLHEITVRELVAGYVNSEEECVVAYGGKLDVRPKYQREFIYSDRQQQAVIDTVTKGHPLNVMYWAVRGDGTYEVIDGQQRTLSLCEYAAGRFAYMFRFDEVATSAAWIAAIEGEEDEEGKAEGEALEYGIDTYVYTARPALDLNKFDHMIATRWPSNIIRAKGLCYFSDDTDKCWLFEQAGRQKSLRDAGLWFATMEPDELQAMMERDRKLRQDWDPVYGDRMQKIVFIGQHLDKPGLEAMMDSCLAE